MGVTSTMKWMGRSARNRAEVVGHQVKDRALQMRLDRAVDENERLRTENETLRDSVGEARADHRRIMDLLESRLVADVDQDEATAEERSHKGRWLFLLLLAGGAWAWMRSTADRRAMDEDWGSPPDTSGSSDAGMAA